MNNFTQIAIFWICIATMVCFISYNNLQKSKLHSFNEAIDNCAGSSLCIEAVGKAYRIKENGTAGVESTTEVLERIKDEKENRVRK